LTEIFNIIANNQDVDENDDRLYIIQELLDHLDIEILSKSKYTELKFVKMEEDFDKDVFSSKELKIISKICQEYKNDTPRKIANSCFSIDKVRQTSVGDIII